MSARFTSAEYLHVILNPLPVYGLAVGLLGLLIALFLRAPAARITALVIICISALAAWPVYQTGERSEDRVLPLLDDDGRQWLEEHERRGERLILLFYLAALLALSALLAERFAPRVAVSLAIATLVAAIASVTVGAYISAAGGRIRHREFRYVPPPPE